MKIAFLSGLLAFCSSDAFGATWRLHLLQVDDIADVYINGAKKYTCTYEQKTCTFDLTSSMLTGVNTIRLDLTNSSSAGGYVLGYVLAKDAETYDSFACGIYNLIGCYDSSLNTGIVWSHSWVVTK
jgi:hypothetical protein